VFGGLKNDNLHSATSLDVTNEVCMLDTTAAAPAWQLLDPMIHRRKFANSVILPNGWILIVGGGTGVGHGVPGGGILESEVFVDGAWSPCGSQATERTYHSWALLLPDGRVLSGGGDSCTLGMEYEIYKPGYLGSDVSILSVSTANLSYGAPFTATCKLEFGQQLDRLVLMAPGSVTHGHDPNQRYFQMTITSENPGPNGSVTVTVLPPANRTEVPPGNYMMFAVTSMGTPSVATWVTVN
jgi:galactose oxidase